MDTLQITTIISIMETLDEETLYEIKRKIDEMIVKKENHKWIEHFLENGKEFEKQLYESNFKSTRGKDLYVTCNGFKYCINIFDERGSLPLLIRDIENRIYWKFTGFTYEYQIEGRHDNIEHKSSSPPSSDILNYGVFLWKYYI
jgi:hypothetical protein